MAYNHVMLIGNITGSSINQTEVGKRKKTEFAIAVERYTGKNESHPNTEVDFFNIVAWGKLGDICFEYLTSGSKVLVDGMIQIRNTGKRGKRQWLTEIVAENIKFMKAGRNNENTIKTTS